jgi:outer membrane murein-binding lipoprotein Lpp
MEETLTNLWEKFKKLVWWKKALILLPLPIVLIVAVVCLVLVAGARSRQLDNAVDYGKEQVDARVQDNVEQDKKLAAKDKKLAAKQQELRQDVQEHAEQAAQTNSDIVNAADAGDITDLIRIHKQLNNKQRRGAASVRLGVTGTPKNH